MHADLQDTRYGHESGFKKWKKKKIVYHFQSIITFQTQWMWCRLQAFCIFYVVNWLHNATVLQRFYDLWWSYSFTEVLISTVLSSQRKSLNWTDMCFCVLEETQQHRYWMYVANNSPDQTDKRNPNASSSSLTSLVRDRALSVTSEVSLLSFTHMMSIGGHTLHFPVPLFFMRAVEAIEALTIRQW